MSISPIQFNHQVCLNASQVSDLRIDRFGSSPLFPDSIFDVNYTPNDKYFVTRIHKADIDFPAGIAVVKPRLVIAAMRIRESGLSDLPELKNYLFTWRPSADYETYTITKRLK
ncbi:MAG: hypothetical protein FJZ56_05030 [Chlamydiae bacterium]|nr:hypothetical protein [Chlamydiota bacterium]